MWKCTLYSVGKPGDGWVYKCNDWQGFTLTYSLSLTCMLT